MMMLYRIGVALAFTVSFSGVNAEASPIIVDHQIIIDRIWQKSGLPVSGDIRVISNESEYRSALVDYDEEFVEIDFSTGQVLLIDRGRFWSGGYSIQLDDIEKKNDETLVKVTYTSPGDNCAVTDALTHPRMFLNIETTTRIKVTTSHSQDKPCKLPEVRVSPEKNKLPCAARFKVDTENLIVTSDSAILRQTPSVNALSVFMLHQDQKLMLFECDGQWVHVGAYGTNGKTGWIRHSDTRAFHEDQ